MAVTDRRDGVDSAANTTDLRAGLVDGVAFKRAVVAATIAAITLVGEQTIDGVAVVADDRVLVKNQTDGAENGIYTVSTGNWERTLDADGNNELVTGTLVFVISGSTYTKSFFYLSTSGSITIDSTSLTWTSFIPGVASALTNHAVLVGNAAGGITSISVGVTKSLLQGATGADPAFTTTPTVAGLTVSANAAALPTVSGAILQVGAADGTGTSVLVDTFGTGLTSTLILREARGTAAAPSAVQSGDTLGNISFRGYGATAYSSSGRAAVTGFAAENWTDSAQGTYLSFGTTPASSTTRTERARLGSGGLLTVNQNSAGIDSLFASAADVITRFVGADGTTNQFLFETYGANSVVVARRADNTGASPSALGNATSFGAFQAQGWDGSTFAVGGFANFLTTEVWSGSANGSKLQVRLKATGTTTLFTVLDLSVASSVVTAAVGVAGTSRGVLELTGNTSGSLKITVPAVAGSGTITLPAGTTDFSATGGTSQFVRQNAAGDPFTVVRPGITDLAATTANRLFGTDGSGVSGLITLPAAGITLSAGAIALANDLGALEALSSTGFAARTTTDTWAQRTLTEPAAGLTISNPAGIAGNPTFALANDLAAVEGLSSTGIARRTGTDTWSVGTNVSVAEGGTGAATFTSNGVLYGNGTSAIQVTSQGAANSILTANAGAPSFSATPTIGTSVTVPLVIGGTGASSTLIMESTSGTGTSDSIQFKTGSQVERARFSTGGVFTFSQNSTAIGSLPADPTGTIFKIAGADATTTRILVDAWAAIPSISARRANGTAASPSALSSGDQIFNFSGLGYGATAYLTTQKVFFSFNADENWTDAASGTRIAFAVTANGTTGPGAEVVRISNSGGLSVGTTSDPGTGLIYTNSASFMNRSKTSWTNGAGALTGTLTNSPATGNPTKWIPVDDNGTTRYVPAW